MQAPCIEKTPPVKASNALNRTAPLNLTELPESTLAKICDALDDASRRAVAALGSRSLMEGLLQPQSRHLQSRLVGTLQDGLREPQALIKRLTSDQAVPSVFRQTLEAAQGLQFVGPIRCPQAIVEGIKSSWVDLPRDQGMKTALDAHAQALAHIVAQVSGPLNQVFEQLWYVSAMPGISSIGASYQALFQSILQRTQVVDLHVLYLQGKLENHSLWEPFTFAWAARLLLEHGTAVTTLRLNWDDVIEDPGAGEHAVNVLLHGMPQLTSLDLRHDRFGINNRSSAMQALTGHPICASLEVLRISGHGHSYLDPGTHAFLQYLSVHAKHLKHLEMDGLTFHNRQAAVDFAHQLAPLAPRLTSLAVSEGDGYMYPYMDDEGHRQLAAAAAKTPVVALRMANSPIRWFDAFAAMRPAPLQTRLLQKRRFERLCETDGWLSSALT